MHSIRLWIPRHGLLGGGMPLLSLKVLGEGTHCTANKASSSSQWRSPHTVWFHGHNFHCRFLESVTNYIPSGLLRNNCCTPRGHCVCLPISPKYLWPITRPHLIDYANTILYVNLCLSGHRLTCCKIASNTSRCCQCWHILILIILMLTKMHHALLPNWSAYSSQMCLVDVSFGCCNLLYPLTWTPGRL